MNTLKLLFLSISILFCTMLFAETSPVPMLQGSADSILATLEANKGNLKNNHALINQAVRRHLLPNVDVSGMARSVLGRVAWSKATASEKAAFSKAFTDLVIRTYASPLAEYSDEKIKFSPVNIPAGARFARVNSIIIRSNGKNIPLSYNLVAKDGQWKIYDFSVEGVSLLQSFRSQFSQVLQGSNVSALIAQMSAKAVQS